MTVAIVVVSHSDLLARGVVELAGQMAEGVGLYPVGGDDDGGIGTSFDRLLAAFTEADDGDGVVVLADLGSAELATEQAIEFLEPDAVARTRLARAPIAEGTIAAATTAGVGAGLEEVLAAAEAAAGASAPAALPGPDDRADAVRERVQLRNQLGLHARPAADLVRRLRGVDADVRITRTDTGASASAASVLDVVGLAATGGVEVEFAATGADAAAVVAELAELAASGFGEQVLDAQELAAAAQADGPAGSPSAAESEAAAPAAAGAGPAAVPGVPAPGAVLHGVGVVEGTVIGRVATLRRAEVDVPQGTGHDPKEERAVLAEARRAAEAALNALAAGADGEIFAMHLVLLADPALAAAVEAELAAGRAAAAAWLTAVEQHEARIAAMPDEAFAARALDVRDVGERVLGELLGADAVGITPPPPGAVVCTADLTPSHIPQLAAAGVAGLATAVGSRTSHAAILAGNLGIPLVMRLGEQLLAVAEETEVILDGAAGTLTVAPDEATRAAALAAIDAHRAAAETARRAAREPGRLADGTRIHIGANASTPEEARRAVAQGAEGIGLLRTEFLFTERRDLPDEDEQVAALAAVCEALERRPVIVRTLDVGGDKPAPALHLDPVANGFLGVRGLRLSLARPDLFRTQLRALLRVAADHDVSVMFPMVTTASEVIAAKAALAEAAAALSADGVPYGAPREVGVMIEVPAAAVAPEAILEEVDFCSVGSNDLIGYTMAADRTLEAVADLYDPDHPAIDRLVGGLCEAAAARDCWVGVCGQMAGDPTQAVRLVGLGVRELSMPPGAIPAVKARLRES